MTAQLMQAVRRATVEQVTATRRLLTLAADLAGCRGESTEALYRALAGSLEHPTLGYPAALVNAITVEPDTAIAAALDLRLAPRHLCGDILPNALINEITVTVGMARLVHAG